MKLKGYEIPKSGFLSLEKDMSLITDKIISNDRLKKLLFYSSRDCLSREKLTDEETQSLFGKQIKMVPKLTVDGSVLTYIIISFDNFTESSNPEFRDNIIEFDIICHFDQWQLDNFQLRPYKIAGELDAMFNDSRLTGIGKTQFLGASQIILTDEFAGLCLMYEVVHDGEDKKNAPDPIEQLDIEENFNKIFNQ